MSRLRPRLSGLIHTEKDFYPKVIAPTLFGPMAYFFAGHQRDCEITIHQ